MTSRTRTMLLFAASAAVCLSVLWADLARREPTDIPAPAYADSLAGVIARLFPGRADSTAVSRVRWRQSGESYLGLNWIPADPYRYRDSTLTGLVPMHGQADPKAWTITFAKGQLSVGLAKHELAHLLLNEPWHPADVFHRLESFTGR